MTISVIETRHALLQTCFQFGDEFLLLNDAYSTADVELVLNSEICRMKWSRTVFKAVLYRLPQETQSGTRKLRNKKQDR